MSTGQVLLLILKMVVMVTAMRPSAINYLVNVFSTDLKSTIHCHGAIITGRFVITTATCVTGYKEVQVSTVISNACPQHPLKLMQPLEVYVHRDYLSELSRSFLRNNLAVLVFPNDTFQARQIIKVPFELGQRCKSYFGHEGTIHECTAAGFVAKTVMVRESKDAVEQYRAIDTTLEWVQRVRRSVRHTAGCQRDADRDA